MPKNKLPLDVDTEKLVAQATDIAETVKDQAVKISAVVADQAADLGGKALQAAKDGAEWAAPRAQRAWKETVKAAAPVIDNAAEKLAPVVTDAAEKLKPMVDSAQDKIVDDVLPRISQAMKDAAAAASEGEGVADKAKAVSAATEKAITSSIGKPRGKGAAKTIGWLLAGTAAAGTGYLLWRRSQPAEDPWAEEYWEDPVLEEDSFFDAASPVAAEVEPVSAVTASLGDSEEPLEASEEPVEASEDSEGDDGEDAPEK